MFIFNEEFIMAEKVKRKRGNNFGDAGEISEGHTRYDLLRFILEEEKKKNNKRRATTNFCELSKR